MARDGMRREWTLADVANAGGAPAGRMQAAGVKRGDVVLTLIGNRSEWVLAMVGCYHGAAVLPCDEQQRQRI